MMGAFAGAALILAAAGLAVLPLGGDDGKVPLVKWADWKRRPGQEFIRTLIEKHPYANIGIICGLSGVTIVDIDDLDLLSLMLERFGETPLRTHTPSGGVHLWYRNSGEGCCNLRKREGLSVDIKGNGGQVVVPPSVRFNGQNAGRSYGFIAGSWSELPLLPTIRPGALTAYSKDERARDGSTPHAAGLGLTQLRAVKEGYRNDMLFCSLLQHAKSCTEFGSLFDAAEKIKADFDPPLPAADVAKTAHSAWGYETTGRNWVGQAQRVYVLASELNEFAGCPDALLLLLKVQAAHWSGREFALSPKGLVEADFLPGWRGHKRYQRARDALLGIGKLVRTYEGGKHQHDPSQYMLTPCVQTETGSRGPETGPNITKTPPLSLSPLSEKTIAK